MSAMVARKIGDDVRLLARHDDRPLPRQGDHIGIDAGILEGLRDDPGNRPAQRKILGCIGWPLQRRDTDAVLRERRRYRACQTQRKDMRQPSCFVSVHIAPEIFHEKSLVQVRPPRQAFMPRRGAQESRWRDLSHAKARAGHPPRGMRSDPPLENKGTIPCCPTKRARACRSKVGTGFEILGHSKSIS